MNGERVVGLRGWLSLGDRRLHGDSLLMRCELCYSIRIYKVYDCNYSVSGYHMQAIIRLQTPPLSSQAKLPYPFLSCQPALTPTLLPSPNRCSRLLLYVLGKQSNKRLHLLGLGSSVGSDVGGCFYYLCPLPSFLIVQYSTTFYYAARVNPPVPLYSLRSSAKLPRGTFTSKPPVTSENV